MTSEVVRSNCSDSLRCMAPALSKAAVLMPAMSILGQSTVVLSSLVVVGSFFWVPLLLIYCLRKCKTWKSRLAVLSFFVLITLVPLKVMLSVPIMLAVQAQQSLHILLRAVKACAKG